MKRLAVLRRTAAALLSGAAVTAALAVPAPAALPHFDLSVNNAPASQVFMQMAAGTPYNMLVSPEVAGTVSITLKNTTLPEALDTMREMFGYDYRITGNRIFVLPNTVQTRIFHVSYLPERRQGASDLRVTSSSITDSGAGGTSGGASTNGSMPTTPANGSNGGATQRNDSAHIHTTSDADFWKEVSSSLQSMVGTSGGRSVVLNPAAGVVVARATPAELRMVEQYLKAVQLSIDRQVMIEAKIVEVQLNKDTQTGINWSAFGKILSGKVGATIGVMQPGVTLGASGALVNPNVSVNPTTDAQTAGSGAGFYGLALQATNFAALLNFLQTQGDVQVLSSPRIATINNQKAVLKVGSDELFVTGVSSSTTSTGNSTVSTPTLTLTPFFSGIALDVTPQIDEAGDVMLHVHPAISAVTEKTKNLDLGSLGSFSLPLAASTVSETDSIVRVHDGDFVAIGGLMVESSNDGRSGIPVLSDAPLIGGLFRQTSKATSKHELVILMKPTVIQDGAGGWPDAQMPATTLGQR